MVTKTKKKRKIKRPPQDDIPAGTSTKLETFSGARDYFRDLKRFTDLIATLTRTNVLSFLETLDRTDSDVSPLEDTDLLTNDAITVKERNRLRKLQQAIDRAELQFNQAIDTDTIRKAASKASRRTDKLNAKQVDKQIKRVQGVQRIETPSTAKQRASFVRGNVKLIKTIPTKHFGKIREIVDTGFQKGTSSSVLKKRILEVADVTKRRAALIARDQIGSLNATMAKERQTRNGIEKFVWRTVGDERVREEHEALEGQTFKWTTGAPSEGFPGDPINCRCFAEPVL